MAEVKCKNCGKVYDDSKASCPNCYSQERETLTSASSEAMAMAERMMENDRKRFLKPAAILLSVIAVVALMCVFIPDKDDSKKSLKDLKNYSNSDSSSIVDPEDQVLSDIHVSTKSDYYSSDSAISVNISFYDQDMREMSPTGTASISIKNSLGETVYTGSKAISQNDYIISGFISIDIPASEIKTSKATDGILNLTFSSTSGESIKKENITVYGLPKKPTTIKVPNTPLYIENTSYSGHYDKKLKITSITAFKGSSSSVIVTMDITMVSNGQGRSSNDYSDITYKFKDSDGVILDSGTFFVSKMSVGDEISEEFRIYGVTLAEGEEYSLELYDD